MSIALHSHDYVVGRERAVGQHHHYGICRRSELVATYAQSVYLPPWLAVKNRHGYA